VICRAYTDHIVIIVMDDAKPFNPLDKEDPNPHTSLDERQVGGWGIAIVKKFMDSVTYQHLNNRNQLILEKYYVH